MNTIFKILFPALLLSSQLFAQPRAAYNLRINQLPARWDQALPMGNGILGCLLWGKNGNIRLALDRADLWDLRPMKGLDRPEFNYKWVAEQVAKGEYGMVQQYFDAPYEQEAGPTKLPGAAVELQAATGVLPALKYGELDLKNGLSALYFENGMTVKCFVSADKREGWLRVQGIAQTALPKPVLISPWQTAAQNQAAGGSVSGDGLGRLGYTPAPLEREGNLQYFHQPCWGGFSYETALLVLPRSDGFDAVWTISSHFKQKPGLPRASEWLKKAAKRGFDRTFQDSADWWEDFWGKSAVNIPDSLIERQYYADQYKFGCVARANAPMISLQAVWTADNGRLPPWKGDFHHDLNTQMSYWPAYTANHTDLARGYLNHIESTDSVCRAYTRRYFGTTGLNVPGVATLLGDPMGGWIQYSCSPTTSAWLAEHFYRQWRYTRDRNFLSDHAWPFLRDAAQHLEQLTYLNYNGLRVLPLSSSPEINDNSLQAWFPNTLTNYDLALIRFVFEKTAELALELNRPQDEEHWRKCAGELPEWSVGPGRALRFAPTLPYAESHRHFSHLMSVYPLGLIDWNQGAENQEIIKQSLQALLHYGPGQWTGYSYAWLACLQARAHQGGQARGALYRFADGFVSTNSFHLNGDQSGNGYSSYTYSPFTLEGNFAAAAGLQEMLLQSFGEAVELFPAVPESWRDVSFRDLRAEGAFLLSAERKNGRTSRIEVKAEQGGLLQLRLDDAPMKPLMLKKCVELPSDSPGIRCFKLKKGGKLVLALD